MNKIIKLKKVYLEKLNGDAVKLMMLVRKDEKCDKNTTVKKKQI